jgi:signal peptidase I
MNVKKYRMVAARWWKQEIRPFLILAVLLFSLRSSLADWNRVPSCSMKPTIVEGDYIFINKLAYDLKVPFTRLHIAEWGNPQRGDIVVCFSPTDGTRLVKRVVGIPGDIIEMRNEQLILNGEPVEYSAPDARWPMQLSKTEREHSLFATEHLPDQPHAVMAINGVPAMRSFKPVRIAEDQYFMMGDNRDNSLDSRYYGTVARREIVGRATSVIVSFDRGNYWLPRLNRTCTSLYSSDK